MNRNKNEFTQEELEKIRQWAEQEEAAGDTPAEYHFANPDPYAKCEPLPVAPRMMTLWFSSM